MDIESFQRQRHQRGLAKVKTRMYYRKNRAKAKLRARKRYKVMRHRPAFKRRQKIRRKKPWVFKRRYAQEIVPTDIAVYDPIDDEIVGIKSVNPEEGTVTLIKSQDEEKEVPIEEILERVEFLTWDDIEGFYDLLDNAFLDEDEERIFDEMDRRYVEEFGGEPKEEESWGAEDKEWDPMIDRIAMIGRVVSKWRLIEAVRSRR